MWSPTWWRMTNSSVTSGLIALQAITLSIPIGPVTRHLHLIANSTCKTSRFTNGERHWSACFPLSPLFPGCVPWYTPCDLQHGHAHCLACPADGTTQVIGRITMSSRWHEFDYAGFALSHESEGWPKVVCPFPHPVSGAHACLVSPWMTINWLLLSSFWFDLSTTKLTAFLKALKVCEDQDFTAVWKASKRVIVHASYSEVSGNWTVNLSWQPLEENKGFLQLSENTWMYEVYSLAFRGLGTLFYIVYIGYSRLC